MEEDGGSWRGREGGREVERGGGLEGESLGYGGRGSVSYRVFT